MGPNLVFGLLLIGATFVAPLGVAPALVDWLRWLVRVEEPPPTEPRPTGQPTTEPLPIDAARPLSGGPVSPLREPEPMGEPLRWRRR